MDPKQDRQMRSRGAALSGNLVITGAGGFGNSPRIIATDKETGKVVWETSFSDTPDVTFTAAPLAIKDKIIVGAANGDQGVRDWIAGLDAKTGKRLWRQFTIPAPGEPGSDTWKGNTNAWQTGGGAVWVL
jgi:alcohol dehydrogenase (cytochrome c)